MRDSQLFSMLFIVILCVAIIFIPFILFRKDLKSVVKIFFTGAMIFFIGDVMLRFPIQRMIPVSDAILKVIVYALVSVVVAIGFRIFILNGVLKKNRLEEPIKTGLVLGMGQAAMEAIVIGFNYFANYSVATKINDGSIYDLVNETLTLDKIEESVAILKSITEFEILASGWIQVMYIIIYAGFAFLVMNALKETDTKKWLVPALIFLSFYISEAILTIAETNLMIRALVITVFALILGYVVVMNMKGKKLHETI